MKVYYDGIISSLQKTGGISVYFRELIERMPSGSFEWAGDALFDGVTDAKIFDDRLFERYRCARNPADSIFHSSYYRLPRRSSPTVLTMHDFTHEKITKGVKGAIFSAYKRLAARSADRIICVSENTARDLGVLFGIKGENIRVVYNGVSSTYHKLSNTTTEEYVLFVGSRAPYKRFDEVAKAVANSPYRLVIVGPELTPRERTLLNSIMLPGQFSFEGYVGNERLNKLYNRAFCLAYPSDYEGFGIPVLESMSTGTPVICQRKSSIPEVAGEAGVYIDQADADSILRSINSLKIGRNREAYARAGLNQAKKFSWDKCASETINIYKELGFGFK